MVRDKTFPPLQLRQLPDPHCGFCCHHHHSSHSWLKWDRKIKERNKNRTLPTVTIRSFLFPLFGSEYEHFLWRFFLLHTSGLWLSLNLGWVIGKEKKKSQHWFSDFGSDKLFGMLEFNEKQCDVLGDCRGGQFLLYESSNWKPLSSLSISRISRELGPELQPLVKVLY